MSVGKQLCFEGMERVESEPKYDVGGNRWLPLTAKSPRLWCSHCGERIIPGDIFFRNMTSGELKHPDCYELGEEFAEAMARED